MAEQFCRFLSLDQLAAGKVIKSAALTDVAST